MLVILKGEPVAGQNSNALDRVAVAGCKNFPRAPRPRVPLTYRITDIGRGAVIRVENAHPIPLKVKPTISRSATCPVSFLQHLHHFRDTSCDPCRPVAPETNSPAVASCGHRIEHVRSSAEGLGPNCETNRIQRW